MVKVAQKDISGNRRASCGGYSKQSVAENSSRKQQFQAVVGQFEIVFGTIAGS
jgi:hypothetical protein